jgi:hypothetical protein
MLLSSCTLYRGVRYLIYETPLKYLSPDNRLHGSPIFCLIPLAVLLSRALFSTTDRPLGMKYGIYDSILLPKRIVPDRLTQLQVVTGVKIKRIPQITLMITYLKGLFQENAGRTATGSNYNRKSEAFGSRLTKLTRSARCRNHGGFDLLNFVLLCR